MKFIKKKCEGSITDNQCLVKCVSGNVYCKKHKKFVGINKIVKFLKNKRSKRNYIKLTNPIKQIVRKYHKNKIKIPRNKQVRFYDKEGSLVSIGYERLVVGNYGASFEFNSDQIGPLATKSEKWREKNIYAKYKLRETSNGIKVYEQTKTVLYADYRPGYFYINPNDLLYL